MADLTPTQENNVRLAMLLARQTNLYRSERAQIWREAVTWMREHGADQELCDLATVSNPYLSQHHDG